MFRFFSHHDHRSHQVSKMGAGNPSLKTPLFEGEIAVGSTLSMRILPESNAPEALLLQYSSQAEAAATSSSSSASSSSSIKQQKYCEVQLFIDGHYLVSAFFPQKPRVRASCLLSDPMMTPFPAVQIVPRAPKTNLKVSNVFFGAAPLKTPLEERRLVLQRHIVRELEMAKAANYHSDLAHADPTCSVLFVEVKIDISEMESMTTATAIFQSASASASASAAYVPLHLYWRPTWVERVPPWTVKCLGTATHCLMRLFSLESGRAVENFEEAEEKSKQSCLMMQM